MAGGATTSVDQSRGGGKRNSHSFDGVILSTGDQGQTEDTMKRSWQLASGAVLVVFALVWLVGCSAQGSSLEGTKWKLSGWTLSSLDPAGFTITADFADGRISGTSAVNSYGGPYKAGLGNAFAAGPLSSTLMAGPEPAMRAEQAYTKLLGDAKSYRVEGARLTLYDANGNESLIFSAVR
jgi:heat shock protein HslJ